MIITILFIVTVIFICWYYANKNSTYMDVIHQNFLSLNIPKWLKKTLINSIVAVIYVFEAILFLFWMIIFLLKVIFFGRIRGYSTVFTNSLTFMFFLLTITSFIGVFFIPTNLFGSEIILVLLPIVSIQIPVLYYKLVSKQKSIIKDKETNTLALIAYISFGLMLITYILMMNNQPLQQEMVGNNYPDEIQMSDTNGTEPLFISSLLGLIGISLTSLIGVFSLFLLPTRIILYGNSTDKIE